MPPRRFDGPRLRAVRRAAEMHQHQLAEDLGLGSHVQVARWESGKAFPAPEKLPAIAKALHQHLDDLFPRDGSPDLADLRCDAGFSQGSAADVVQEVSRFQLGAAERGRRRLDSSSLPAVARAYGVSVEDLVAAQDRSFGEFVPATATPAPQTLAEKLTELLQATFPEVVPSDADVAAGINAMVGSEAINAAQIEALRAGTPPDQIFTDAAQTMAFEALGLYFGVSPLHFQDDKAIERRVLDDIRYLAEQHQIALAARGGEGGVSDAFLAVLNELIDSEIREHGDRQPPAAPPM
ncbi:helix-turn-helix domain-containing protein [Streptomyces sp. NPDC056178]|uniref:helix-turn-helix domain-containing protein n=1 Tax=unclassified Streptomyces TaxID=2593676 RepID=UPI0035E13794